MTMDTSQTGAQKRSNTQGTPRTSPKRQKATRGTLRLAFGAKSIGSGRTPKKGGDSSDDRDLETIKRYIHPAALNMFHETTVLVF